MMTRRFARAAASMLPMRALALLASGTLHSSAATDTTAAIKTECSSSETTSRSANQNGLTPATG